MSTAKVALRACRDALSAPAWIVGSSMLGVGSLARDAGHPLGAAMFSSIAIWAAPAQVIFYAGLAGGGLLVATAIAVGFSAIRLLPMTISIMPYLRRPGQTIWEQLALAHLVAATNWIEGMRRLPHQPPEDRTLYFAAFGTTCLAVSTLMTALGYLLVGSLPVPLAAGVLCLTPIYFTISMVGGARHAADLLAVLLGLVLLPVAQILFGRDFDILIAGLAGGTLAWAFGRMRRRRAA